MENLTQKDPAWRENGKSFVESVTRLLERLLDYRNVGQVSILSIGQQIYSWIKKYSCIPLNSIFLRFDHEENG